jgi:radical SAM superfamily enzyme YgiQ (UPF0313 family)
LDLLNCAALLRNQGHDVAVVDGRANAKQLAEIEHDYDWCFFSLSPLDRWQCPNTDFEYLAPILDPFPKERLVIMGAQPTLAPQLLLEKTSARAAILGEPEMAVLKLCQGAIPGEAAGTAILEDGVVKQGPEGEDLDLAKLPIPAFDLIDFADYRYEVLGNQMGLLELTRGCPWSCGFCLLSMYPKKYRRKSTAQMVSEIKHAQSLGMRCAYFQDLEFTLDCDFIMELCESMLAAQLKLRWACQTRPDTVNQLLLESMAKAGCELIHFGVESGVQRVVDLTDKRQSLAQVENALNLAHQAGMRTLCYFLIGIPGESPEEMEQSLQFAQRLSPTYASFQVATPYPGTPFYDEQQFDQVFPESFQGPLNGQELRALARRYTLKFHLNPGYLWQRTLRGGFKGALAELGLLYNYIRA